MFWNYKSIHLRWIQRERERVVFLFDSIKKFLFTWHLYLVATFRIGSLAIFLNGAGFNNPIDREFLAAQCNSKSSGNFFSNSPQNRQFSGRRLLSLSEFVIAWYPRNRCNRTAREPPADRRHFRFTDGKCHAGLSLQDPFDYHDSLSIRKAKGIFKLFSSSLPFRSVYPNEFDRENSLASLIQFKPRSILIIELFW